MSDTYYRDRILRAQVDAENARVARMVALQDALYDVVRLDDEVLTDDQRDVLRKASFVVADLRRTW